MHDRFPGSEVISVDTEPKFRPTYRCGVEHWANPANPFGVAQYRKGHFDLVWASPECTQFSQAKTTGQRDLRKASVAVKAVKDILAQLQPRYFVIENPLGRTPHALRL